VVPSFVQVMSLLEEAKSGAGPLNAGPSLLPGHLTAGGVGSTPPLSPRSSGSPMSPRSPFSRRVGPSHVMRDSPLKKTSEPVREIIPQVMPKILSLCIRSNILCFNVMCIRLNIDIFLISVIHDLNYVAFQELLLSSVIIKDRNGSQLVFFCFLFFAVLFSKWSSPIEGYD